MATIENFGQTVYEARRKVGLTQDALGEILGITPQAISKWENGIGYPDVTLFPEIAQALDIPIERLFGIERENRSEMVSFPPTKDDLTFIFSVKNIACYSSKTVDRVDTEKNIAYFTDGSYAQMGERSAYNCGEGEIRFFESDVPDSVYDTGKSESVREFDSFSSIDLSIPVCCEVKIKRACDGERGRVEARGKSEFIARLVSKIKDSTLYIRFENGENVKGDNNKLVIFVPIAEGERVARLKIALNGASNVTTELDARILDAHINGCGDVNAKSVNILEAKINGAGNLTLDDVAFSASLTVNGAGDLRARSVCTPVIKINGAGEAKIDRICGENAVIDVSGAGTIVCGGEVDNLVLKADGACRFICPTLVVAEANLTLKGSGNVEIGRIVYTSNEKIGKNTTLKVHHRGEK